MPDQFNAVMRAPTFGERISGALQRGWESVRDHPAIRALDLAGITDRGAWDRSFTEPDSGFRMGAVQGPGGSNALDDLASMGLNVARNIPTSKRGPAVGSSPSPYGLNASGEAGRGGPSMEALARAAGERASGRQAVLRGPGGTRRPYVGDAADAVVNPGWEIGYELPGGGWERIR